MRWTLRVIAPTVAAVLIFAPVGAHASTPAVAAPSSATSDDLTAANFASVNAQRVAAGVVPVQMQSWAQAVAQTHSLVMADANNIFHNMTGYMALGRSAMGATYLGENVAMGTNLDYAQTALITSPLHRANTLNPRFNYVGIGAATDAAGEVYITEDFAEIPGGAARPAAPAPAPIIAAPVAAVAPAPVVAPTPVVAPKPVVTTPPAPKPVVAPTPVVAPKPVIAAPLAPAPAPPVAAAPVLRVDQAAVPVAALSVPAHSAPTSPAALLLYGMLALVGVSFSLGLGYKLTRFLPGR